MASKTLTDGGGSVSSNSLTATGASFARPVSSIANGLNSFGDDIGITAFYFWCTSGVATATAVHTHLYASGTPTGSTVLVRIARA